MEQINIISEKEMFEKLNMINIRLNRYISTLDDISKNQILKAKENNIYLLLDENFLASELRQIRSCLLEKNIENFIINYEERKINNKTYYYKYKITKTNDNKYIVVDILEKNDTDWNPSNDFNYRISKMILKKENTIFKKFISYFYEKYYPFDNPEQVKEINNIEHEYLIRLLRNKEKYLNSIILDAFKKDVIPLNIKIIEIKETKKIIQACMFKLDFKKNLSEQEILVLNELIEQKKYNIFLNIRNRKRK